MAGVWKGALLKSGGAYAGQSANPVMDLYRRACKEIPRVMTIYDIDMDSAVVSERGHALDIATSGSMQKFCAVN